MRLATAPPKAQISRMDGPALYDTDILAWTEEQAAALRALAGRRDLPNALDLENVIEEIESVGRSQFHAVESRLRLMLEHLLKLASAPEAPARGHWVDEVLHWQAELLSLISPSMHQRIELDQQWRRACRLAERSLAAHGDRLSPGLPEACPFTLADFLVEDFDPDAALGRLTRPQPSPP